MAFRHALIVLTFLALTTTAMAEPPASPTEASVSPGINDTWKSDDVERLTGILEAEDREIWTGKADLAALAGPVPGAIVADIGAGSGFLTVELAKLVGVGGKTYAVDINPKMLEGVEARAQLEGVRVETVLTGERSVDLPPESLDMAFICDTYHHFEYPMSSMASLYRAMKPGGQVVVVDFHRIEGVSPEWTLEHVRAGQEVFTREIEEAGFELVNIHLPSFLERNYVLRFRKPPMGAQAPGR